MTISDIMMLTEGVARPVCPRAHKPLVPSSNLGVATGWSAALFEGAAMILAIWKGNPDIWMMTPAWPQTAHERGFVFEGVDHWVASARGFPHGRGGESP